MAVRGSRDESAGAESDRDPERLVSFRCSLVAKHLDRRLASLVDDKFGLAVAEYRVLAQVALHPQSTVRAIATRVLMDKAQVSRTVAVLEDERLVRRAVRDVDRRSPVFSVTPAGTRLINRILPLRRAQDAEMLDRLTAREVAALSRALDTMLEYFGETE